MNLTYATLAALLKYPTNANNLSPSEVARKKHGFFQSEKEIIEEIWHKTGLAEGIRHPLTFIMEACDDIAYAVLDAEDAVKKGLVSFSDLMSYLAHHGGSDPAVDKVKKLACKKHTEYRRAVLSPAELNDISMQMFRVYAIGQMIGDVRRAFVAHYDQILAGNLTHDLLHVSKLEKLCKVLKKFDKEHAYVHRCVLEIELTGYNTVRGLMNFFWDAIKQRTDPQTLDSKRNTPFASYVYHRISENYRRIAEKDAASPTRYRELQLITDMISGNSDTFALSLYDELIQLNGSGKN